MKEKKKLPTEQEREKMDRELRILKVIELVTWSVCLTVHIFIIVMLALGKYGG